MEEAAKRYLEAFKQMVVLASAGPLIVLGIQQAILGGSLPGTASLLILVASLIVFVLSLVLAVYGLVRVAVLNVAGGPLSDSFFLWLTMFLGMSIAIFFIGLLTAFLLFFSSGLVSMTLTA